MKALRLTSKTGGTPHVLTAEDGRNGADRRAVCLNVGYPNLKTWCGIYLEPRAAESLHQWLGEWLKERGT